MRRSAFQVGDGVRQCSVIAASAGLRGLPASPAEPDTIARFHQGEDLFGLNAWGYASWQNMSARFYGSAWPQEFWVFKAEDDLIRFFSQHWGWCDHPVRLTYMIVPT